MTAPISPDHPKAYTSVCHICGRPSLAYDTESDASDAHAWHVFEQHPDVWMRMIGEAREPNVPKPDPIPDQILKPFNPKAN